MKWLFLFLFLANLALAVWGGFGKQNAPNPIAKQEIHPESIRIVQPAPKTALPASAPSPVRTACYRWGVFSGGAVDAAREALKSLSVSASERELSKPAALGYWAYIPPGKTKKEALEEIRKLDALGVKDHFLIQDSGKWQYAISLGIFKSGEAARKYAAALLGRGVKSAASGKRDEGEVEFLIAGLTEAKAGDIGKLDFPKTSLEAANCKTIAEKASPD